MKKILSFMAMIVVVVCTLVARDNNRLIVYPTVGQAIPYVSSRIDSLVFTTIEGRVETKVEVFSVTTTSLEVSFTMSEACSSYKFAIVPRLWNDGALESALAAVSYINSLNEQAYYENFDHGEMTGIELTPGVDYVIMTLSYDKLGTPCDVLRAPFTVPATPLKGNPQVTYKVENVGHHDFTITFDPNADVDGYATVAGEKGTTIDMIKQTAMMFGFSCIGDAIKRWGIEETSKETKTWDKMDAGVEYEVLIQAWDENGTYAPIQTVELKTEPYGTAEQANVNITVGKYVLAEWGEEMLPSQFIKFTPDANTNGYYIGVYLAAQFNKYGQDEIVKGILEDPTARIFYGEMETDFQINPNSEVVAIAIPKNAAGENGSIAVKRFTTPDAVSGAPAYKADKQQTVVRKRQMKSTKMVSFQKFSSPVLNK